MLTEKMQIESDEQIILTGEAAYRKSLFSGYNGQAVLSNKRFVFLYNKSMRLMPSTMDMIFGHMTDNIIFQIPFSNMREATLEKWGLGHVIKIRTYEQEYTISITMGSVKNWFAALQNARSAFSML